MALRSLVPLQAEARQRLEPKRKRLASVFLLQQWGSILKLWYLLVVNSGQQGIILDEFKPKLSNSLGTLQICSLPIDGDLSLTLKLATGIS